MSATVEPEPSEQPDDPYEAGILADPVAMYVREIAGFGHLSPERTNALATRCRAGDLDARNDLVQHYTPLVLGMAKKYQGRGLELADLIQEGNIGLIHAAELFDPKRGYHFITYAMWWVRQALTRAIQDRGATIRIPVHQHQKHARIMRVIEEFRQRYGRPPSEDEIAKEDLLPPDKVRKILERGRVRAMSIEDVVRKLSKDKDDPRDTDSVPAFRDRRPTPDKLVSIGDAFARFLENVNGLPNTSERDKEMFRKRTGIPKEPGGEITDPSTLEATGRVFGVTRERVRQVTGKIMNRLGRALARDEEGRQSIEDAGATAPVGETIVSFPAVRRRRRVTAPTLRRESPQTHSAADDEHPSPATTTAAVNDFQTLNPPSPSPGPTVEPKPTIGGPMFEPEYLKKIAESVGGKALEEFTELMKLASSSDEAETRATEAEAKAAAVTGKYTSLVGELAVLVRNASTVTIPAPTAGDRKINATRAQASAARGHRADSGASKAEQERNSHVPIQLMLVKAAAEGEEALEAAYRRAFRALGISEKKGRRTVGILYARTQGKFRPYFLKRALALIAQSGNGTGLNPVELAKCYSAIESRTVTVADLRAEARE